MNLTDIAHEARIAAASLFDAATGTVNPTVRLGVTGLSRAGKTVFITALVNALTNGARMPIVTAYADGRLIGGKLAPQPDDGVPRFEIERHLAALIEARAWPQSTRRIAELRVVIDYQSDTFFGRQLGASRLTLDIVDYPGEWLLDLGLMAKSYQQWSAETVAMSRRGARAQIGTDWHADLAMLDPASAENEGAARRGADLFTTYLRASREARHALSALPPGRFLMPGDLEGSPMLTFAPLDVPSDAIAEPGTLHAMMQRRYDAYVAQVVKPFFREHFARLDRQIVLIDVLAALDAGPDAVIDLEAALRDVLDAFHHGRNSWLSAIFRPRVDKILFAATKADHLHHTSHDRLEAILGRLVERASERAQFSGAEVEILAIAAVRSTREARITRNGADLGVIVGTPQAGESAGGQVFDGEQEVGVFPGDLPEDPGRALSPGGFRGRSDAEDSDLRFVRFRPPMISRVEGKPRLPHIRLDRAIQFLIGDKLA